MPFSHCWRETILLFHTSSAPCSLQIHTCAPSSNKPQWGHKSLSLCFCLFMNFPTPHIPAMFLAGTLDRSCHACTCGIPVNYSQRIWCYIPLRTPIFPSLVIMYDIILTTWKLGSYFHSLNWDRPGFKPEIIVAGGPSCNLPYTPLNSYPSECWGLPIYWESHVHHCLGDLKHDENPKSKEKSSIVIL